MTLGGPDFEPSPVDSPGDFAHVWPVGPDDDGLVLVNARAADWVPLPLLAGHGGDVVPLAQLVDEPGIEVREAVAITAGRRVVARAVRDGGPAVLALDPSYDLPPSSRACHEAPRPLRVRLVFGRRRGVRRRLVRRLAQARALRRRGADVLRRDRPGRRPVQARADVGAGRERVRERLRRRRRALLQVVGLRLRLRRDEPLQRRDVAPREGAPSCAPGPHRCAFACVLANGCALPVAATLGTLDEAGAKKCLRAANGRASTADGPVEEYDYGYDSPFERNDGGTLGAESESDARRCATYEAGGGATAGRRAKCER